MTHPTATPEAEYDPPPAPPEPATAHVQEPVSQATVAEVRYDQAPAQPQPETEEEPEDIIDVLVPKADVRTWRFGPEDQIELTQRPLSYFGKMQWFGLVGGVVQQTLSGDDGVSVNGLLSAPGRPGDLSVSDFRDADTFIQAVGKLLVAAPDFLERSYCIWLGVPEYRRDLIIDFMTAPPEEGGLTDEQGIEIIEVFIDQNYQALDDFFRKGLGGIANRVQRRAADAASRRSKR